MDFQTFATAELTSLAKKLADAAETRTDVAVAKAVAAAGTDAETALARVRADADAAIAHIRAEADFAVTQARADADSRLAESRSADGHTIARIREEATAEAARLKTDAADAVAKVKADAEAQIAAMRAAAEAEIGAVRSAADVAAKTNTAFGAMVEKLRIDQAELAADNERLAAENAALTYERADILDRTQASPRGPLLSRLASAFDAISAANTVDGVLIAAASGLVEEFPRVAVFAARDHALVSIFHRGFDVGSGLDTVVVPLDARSFLSDAARDTQVRSRRDTAASSAPFGGAPTVIVTAPIVVNGTVAAVIYLDDDGEPIAAETIDERSHLAGLLRAHVTLRLDRLTIELKAIAELKAYAQMLLDEVEYVYEADAGASRPDAERVNRLSENLRCARQIYQQRVTLEGPAAAALLEDVVLRTIERKATQPFGRDLGLAVAPALTV